MIKKKKNTREEKEIQKELENDNEKYTSLLKSQ